LSIQNNNKEEFYNKYGTSLSLKYPTIHFKPVHDPGPMRFFFPSEIPCGNCALMKKQ
jgi:hypothetical protein